MSSLLAINISSSFLFVPLFVLRTTIHCGRTALDNWYWRLILFWSRVKLCFTKVAIWSSFMNMLQKKKIVQSAELLYDWQDLKDWEFDLNILMSSQIDGHIQWKQKWKEQKVTLFFLLDCFHFKLLLSISLLWNITQLCLPSCEIIYWDEYSASVYCSDSVYSRLSEIVKIIPFLLMISFLSIQISCIKISQ